MRSKVYHHSTAELAYALNTSQLATYSCCFLTSYSWLSYIHISVRVQIATFLAKIVQSYFLGACPHTFLVEACYACYVHFGSWIQFLTIYSTVSALLYQPLAENAPP